MPNSIGTRWPGWIRRSGVRARGSGIEPHRYFDPRRVGNLEASVWVSYYRREWLTFLRSAIAVTRHTFGLSWPSTVYAAWLVLRANQLWAPYPNNDPEAARKAMERFYRLVAGRDGDTFDSRRASELEVEWWRVHRSRHHDGSDGADDAPLIAALSALYAHVYGVTEAAVAVAAEQRAAAIRYSDQWVREGCDLSSPLIEEERAALVRAYAGLLAAVHQV